MKRKWILRSIVGLFAIVVLAVLVVAFSLGTIIKKGVERIGPSATQVDVKLKSAQVWLLAWRVELTGFILGNPPGCRTPSAISVGDVTVRFEPKTMFSDKLVVDSINVKAPVITMEGGLRGNNLEKIEKNLNDYIGSSSTAPNSKAPASSPATAKPEKKLQVNDLVITGAKLQVNSALSGDRTVTLPIPDIHLTGLGAGPQGITPVEVSQRALHAILAAATQEVAKSAGQLGKEALSQGKGEAKKAADSIKGLFH
ncbi:MAG TPA: hypothetical protein VGO59_18615 [Verrucomicrobiae bacterium]|jgi:uncharacterized protein involved in outer membrane biogenesis